MINSETPPLTARKVPIPLWKASSLFREEGANYLVNLAQEYGDFCYMPILPGLDNYVISAPDLAYDMLVKNPEQWLKPDLARRIFSTSFGNGIFFSDGDFWRRQRKLLQPAFHHVRIRVYAEGIVSETLHLTQNWHDGATLDIDAEMHALTLVNVVNALFKTDVASATERVRDGMKLLADAANKQMSYIAYTFMPDWVPHALNRDKRKGVEMINEVIYKLVAEHRASPSDTGDLLSMMIEARDEETGESMSDGQIRDELMTMFIAGHETSATALAWALLMIVQHPEIAAKLRLEVDLALNGRLPTLADLPKMPYVQQVIKETMRLYPPVIFIARQPRAKMTFYGKHIRKNDIVNINVIAIHRDARWYADPAAFQPERWTDDFEKGLPKCAYLPFGAGPRICIGNGFAMLEMQLILAGLMQRFSFALAADYVPVKPRFNITLGFDHPLRMTVTRR